MLKYYRISECAGLHSICNSLWAQGMQIYWAGSAVLTGQVLLWCTCCTKPDWRWAQNSAMEAHCREMAIAG